MKAAINTLSALLLVLLVAAPNFVRAEREDSLRVFPQLKRSRRIQSGFASFLEAAQSEVVLSEESFILTSITDESTLHKELAGEDVQASGPHCVQFVRQSSDILMNLAGIAYTNCFNDADDLIFNALSQVPNLQLTREQYEKFNLLGAFRGENIFVDPSTIREKLSTRSVSLVNLPVVSSESLEALRVAFDGIKSSFKSCMTDAQGRLADNLKFSSQQVRAICAGTASKQV
ncbi:uncharacterized protein LOC134216381 [Armigeres subalbatus]|uniref:uncharacterized protein LOC134216381 n=1 Tax=Armigeres subalbatus TaxID=124917 RepID=UPI002ED56B52